MLLAPRPARPRRRASDSAPAYTRRRGAAAPRPRIARSGLAPRQEVSPHRSSPDRPPRPDLVTRRFLPAVIGPPVWESSGCSQFTFPRTEDESMMSLLLLPALLTAPDPVRVTLSEWTVRPSVQAVAAGAVQFAVTNTGSIPHAFEVEGQGIE